MGKKIQPNSIICAYHPFELKIGWRSPKCYCHPNHPILFGKKAPTVRTVPYKVVMKMLQKDHQIPIGAKFCLPHLKNENKKNKCKDSSTPSTNKDTNLMHESCMEPDVNVVPDEPYISSSDLESSLLISESFSATFETSPLPFQTKRKKVSDLSEGTKLKQKQKFLRTHETVQKRFAEAIVPGQTEEFINDALTENT